MPCEYEPLPPLPPPRRRPENFLLLTKEKDAELILGDFGLSHAISTPDEVMTGAAENTWE